MGYYKDRNYFDYGKEPYMISVRQNAMKNPFFRTSVWTGDYLQMTLMSIDIYSEIGIEMHPDTDQFIRIEQGTAIFQFGYNNNCNMKEWLLKVGDGVFIPAGMWHNLKNAGNTMVKLSSIYAPPNHPFGTVEEERDNNH